MRPFSRGVSFIDVIVGCALILIIFLALFGLLRVSLVISELAKTKAAATSIAASQIEYIRSLPYDSIGTIGGIPAGVIPQYATTTENGISYSVRTFIEYADDPADGLGASDTNGIITDYKHIKVAVTYMVNSHPREIDLVSNAAPAGIETTTNGGTLQVNVVNAAGTPLAGASVHITNASTSPTVDLTTFSDANGTVFLPGAATSTQYQVNVSRAGYSTAQTYARDTNNQNPTPGYLTVVKNQTTTGTFAIDALATLTVNSYSPVTPSSWTDSFDDSTQISTTSNTTVSGGTIILVGAGTYAPSGSVRSVAVAPSQLYQWTSASTTNNLPAGTTLRVQVLDGSGGLIPDALIPGNSAGFASFPIDLSRVSSTTYPSLMLAANLSTSDTSVTPTLFDWTLNYNSGPTPLPNVSFTLTGTKTIGSTGAGAPIYKTVVTTSTGASAQAALSLEWDSYNLSVPSYDVIDACGVPPYALSPGSTQTSSLFLSTPSANAILVSVHDSSNVQVAGATVTLSRTGYSQSVTTSPCGTAYFGSLTAANDYTLTVSKTGYTTATYTNVPASGHTFYAAPL